MSAVAGRPSHEAMEQAAEWYALLISDQVAEPDRHRWHAWLDARPEHRQAWRYVEQVSQRMLAPLKEMPDPSQAGDSLHAANLRLRRRRHALAGLSALAVGATLGWIGWRHTPLGDAVVAWRADHATGVGEIREVRLSDGSSVWLNTHSAIDADLGPALRRIRLRLGEILVSTAPDPMRPFVVDTAQGRLRALGTRFTVRLEDGRTFVAVYQGAVEVQAASGIVMATVPAGAQLSFSADAIEPLTPADPAREAWSRGDLVILNLPMEQVVRELRRYTLGHIGLAPEIASHRIFGNFPLGNVDATLALLAEAGHFRIRRPLPWWTTLEPAPASQRNF